MRIVGLLLFVLGVPAALIGLALSDAPAVPPPAAPEATAPERAVALRRAYIGVLRGKTDALTLTREDFEALFALTARLHPDIRGRASPSPEALTIEVSVGAPAPVAWRWLNLRAVAAPSDEGLALSSLRVGRLPLPARVTPRLAAAALDGLFGGDVFSASLASVSRLSLSDEAATIGFADGPPSLEAVGGRTVAGLRRFAFRSDAEALDRHFAAQSQAGPAQGSAAGWVAAALRIAADAAEDGGAPQAEIEAALFALGLHCGDARLSQALGSPRGLSRRSACARLTLGGRGDLRQHFAVSAALHAASSAQPAFAIGEFKELHDSRTGSGFSFDDIAANRAGIRFAERMLAGGPADWRRAAALLADERALFPAVDDLPAGLTEAAFVAQFGGVDSPRYAAMLETIERRLDALPVH